MKTFPTAVVLSVMSGRMCVSDFGQVHECIEHMAGGSVWTHQLPGWCREMKAKLEAAFPELARYDMSGLSRETYEEWAKERAGFLDAPREVPVLGGQPDSPFEGLPDKPVIVVKA